MTVAIIVYILIVTVPLIAAAALTEKLFRLWSLPVRGAWAVTALLIALIGGRTVTQQLIAPDATLSITGINIATTGQTAPTGSPSLVLATLHELMSVPRTAAAYASHFVGPTPNISLTILWLVMSCGMLALICIVYSRVRRARQQWSVADFAGHRVRVAPNAGPAVVGIFRPEIVVPQWMLNGHPDDSQLIIMHEMEHRSARDPVLLAAMWGLVALFPWHPGAWYCLARTRLAIEIDCDARVVGKGASLKNYAQLLVNQARARIGAPVHLWLGATSLL
ncbi:MAG: M56 family metallopeptidase, partial [Gemmatimonadaceae bacterium]